MSIPTASLGGPDSMKYRDIPYAAGNFTGSGTITWTVGSGDQVRLRFAIINEVAFIHVQIELTSVSGAGTELRIALPFSTTATQTVPVRAVDNGTFVDAFVSISGSQLTFIKASGNWSASTDLTSVYYEGSVPLEP